MAGDLDLLTGTWTVKVKGWTWEYDFRRDGAVTWRDLGSIESGVGNWAASSTLVNMWWKGSTTRESWQRPLSPRNDHTWYEATYFRGKYLIEKTGFIPPIPGPPSGPTDQDRIDSAWEASRASLRFALNRLRQLQRQIKFFEDTSGSEAAFNELRRNFRRDIAVISRKLLVSSNFMDPAFRAALTAAIGLMEQNLTLPKSLNAARAGGKCVDPRPAFAWTTPRRRPPDTDLCTSWFSSSADLQRDVVTHEYFHTVGLGDISVSTTANALGNANTMAQVVAFLHDRTRQKNSDGFEPMVPLLPMP